MRPRPLWLLVVAALSACTVTVENGLVIPDDPDDPEFEDESLVMELPAEESDVDPGMGELTFLAIGERLRVCGATSLNQRSGPGTQHAILRAMPEDARVTVVERADPWVRVDWNGLLGWAHGRYLCAVMAPPATSASQSVQKPTAGSLRNAVAMAAHPGYVVANTGRNATWATAETVYWIGRAFDELAARQPGAARVQVRDASVRPGGRPTGAWPHSSHQSGRDVDLTYHRRTCDQSTGCPLGNVSTTTLDVKATWTVLEVWLTNRVARRIFIDSSLHAVLRAEARARGHSTTMLDRWFGPIIMHVDNHLNHVHVRFECPADDASCTN